MKTAISIPDEVFESADALATELGMSRSELYSLAVAEYVANHRPGDVTARLNEVYATEDSKLETSVRRADSRSVGRSQW